MRKAFKYRLYPTKGQEQTLLFVLRRSRHLYNSALEQRKAYYQMRRKSLGYTAQSRRTGGRQGGLPGVPGHL
jgi:putative transposase